MIQNEPKSPGAPDTSWTTGAAWHSPVVSPSPGSDLPAAGGQGIYSPGNPGVQGDDVAASAAAAMAAAEARYHSHEADTHPQGSALGVPMELPPVVSDWSKHTGGSDATAYDPAG
jgi:hypothetical protein